MVEAVKLSDRYRLEDRIARGGMGSIYVATDERLRRRVAVKLLKEELADQPDFVERFRREARAVAALSHPNIASVYDYGEDEGTPYIVMELLEGRDLAQLLQHEGAMPPEAARDTAAQVCDALGYAHSSGVVHRDVKPANVIVTGHGHVKVTDFGIARVLGDTTLTAAGSVLGTAQYISPEQASGGDVGPPSDVYSTGIVLYEMLTGSPPFSGDTPIALAMRHVSENVPAPSETRPTVPADLDEVVATATAKDRARRYATGNEMAAALRGHAPETRVTAAATPTAILPGPTAAPTRPVTAAPTGTSRSFWGRAVGIAAILLLLLVGGVFAATLLGDEKQPQQRQERREPQRREGAAAPEPESQPDLVAVPGGLVGSNVKDAERVLKEHGLEASDEKVESEEAKDVVVGTDPGAGTEVQPGSTVILLVSEGPPEDTGEGEEGEGPPEDHGKKEDKGNKGKGNEEGKDE